MRFSLRQPVRRMAAHVPPALASRDALDRFGRVAEWFPAAITDCVCFELGLTGDVPAADLAFLCRRRSAGPSILAGQSAVTLRDELFTIPAWGAVREFCRRWVEPASAFAGQFSHLILEIDLESEPAGPPVPCVVLGATRSHPADVRWLEPALDTLGASLPPQAWRNLQRLRSSVMTDAMFHVGLMHSRRTEGLRVVFEAAGDRVFSELTDLGAGDLSTLAAIADRVRGLTDVVNVAVDVGESVGRRVGVECKINENVRMDRDRWSRLLDDLVEMGACAPDRRGPLLQWPGGCVERLAHLPLPVAVARKISHFKIVAGPSGPGVHGKAYLFYVM
jgi:hypothetical protein